MLSAEHRLLQKIVVVDVHQLCNKYYDIQCILTCLAPCTCVCRTLLSLKSNQRYPLPLGGNNFAFSFHTQLSHNENLSMQYTEIFFQKQKLKFSLKNFFFNACVQNIDCGYTLEPPRPGGSNEYPQSMCWIENKKNTYTSANSIFFYIKVGFN